MEGIVNKYPWTAEKGLSSSLDVGEVPTALYHIKLWCYKTFHKASVVRRPDEKRPNGRPACSWVDNNNIDSQ
jgi:hypothetical protein